MDLELYRAASFGDVRILEEAAIASNAQLLLAKAPHENTALHIAARFGHAHFTKEILRLCGQLNGMKNSDGDTALHCAARAGCPWIVEILLDHVEEGRSSCVGLLRMQNNDGETALHEALRNRQEEMAIRMLRADPRLAFVVNNAKESSFLLAAKQEMEGVVKEILLAPEADGREIEAAAINNSPELTTEEKKELICVQDNTGRTALHYAAWRNNIMIVQLILKTDSRHVPFIVDNNCHSPLHVAAAFGMKSSFLELFMRCPDTVEQLDASGRNVFHIALLNQRDTIVQELLKQHHSRWLMNGPDKEGNTPFHLASREDTGTSLLPDHRREFIGGSKDAEMFHVVDSTFRDKPQHMPDVIPIKVVDPQKEVDPIKRVDPMKELDPKIMDALNDEQQVYVLVASLIATVAFAAAFTLPGGYRGSDEPNPGTAILASKPAFKAFVLLDTLAMFFSIFAIFCYSFIGLLKMLKKPYFMVLVLNLGNFCTLIACTCMLIALSAGLFVAIAPETKWLAIAVIGICSLLPGCVVAYLIILSLLWIWVKHKHSRTRKPAEVIV